MRTELARNAFEPQLRTERLACRSTRRRQKRNDDGRQEREEKNKPVMAKVQMQLSIASATLTGRICLRRMPGFECKTHTTRRQSRRDARFRAKRETSDGSVLLKRQVVIDVGVLLVLRQPLDGVFELAAGQHERLLGSRDAKAHAASSLGRRTAKQDHRKRSEPTNQRTSASFRDCRR